MAWGICDSCGRQGVHLMRVIYWDRVRAERYGTEGLCYDCREVTKKKLKESGVVTDARYEY